MHTVYVPPVSHYPQWVYILGIKIDEVLSDWKTVKGGVPQGTKLGVILFIVMTNNLLCD